jgi:hypothetical protein
MQINFTNVKRISIMYLCIPIVIFLIGYLKFWIGIPLVLLLGYALFRFWHIEQDEYGMQAIPLDKLIVPLAIFLVWVWFCGIGGYTYQTSDHFARNGVLHDLIDLKWPVYYPDGSALTYYLIFYMFPAVVGKMFGWAAANFAMYVWASCGIFLAALLVSFYVKAITKWQLIGVAVLIVIWGGPNILATRIVDIINQAPGFIGDGWADIIKGKYLYTYQYRNNFTQIQWVFNQAIPAWICCALFINIRKRIELFAFAGLLLLIYSPMPFVGVFPVILILGLQIVKDDYTNKGVKYITKRVLSWFNITGIVLAVVLMSYFSSNTFIESGLHSFVPLDGYDLKRIIILGLFYFCEFLIFMIIISDKYKNDLLFKLTGAVLLVLPLLKIGAGDNREVIMSGSMGTLFLLMILFIDYFYSCEKQNVRYFWCVVVISLCGFEAYANTTTYIKMMYNSKVFPVVSEWKSLAANGLNNYFCYDPENHFFFTKLAKENKNTVNKEEVLNYNFLLDTGNGYNYFSDDSYFYTSEKKGAVLPIEDISLEKQFSIEAIIKPAKTQVLWAALFTSQDSSNPYAFSLEHGDENSNIWYLAYNGDVKSGWTVTPSFTFDDDNWNYLVVNFDLEHSGTITIYVNGKLVSEMQIPETCITLQADPLHIGQVGALGSSYRRFNGIIQEISVKNKTLSIYEIGNNWNKIYKALHK